MLEQLIIFALSTLSGLGCLGAIVWIILSPETLDLDKIFGIIACLVMGLVFGGISAWMLFHTRLRELWRAEHSAPASPPQKAPAAKKEQVPQEAGKTS